MCYAGHGEVQHREGHRSLHQEGEAARMYPSGADIIVRLAAFYILRSIFGEEAPVIRALPGMFFQMTEVNLPPQRAIL